MSDPGFHIRLTHPEPGTACIEISGEVDLCSSTALREQLKRALRGEATLIVLDFEAVRYIDSSGLSCLVGAAHRASERGGTLVIAAPEVRVRRVIEMTGVDRLIPVFETRAEALLAEDAQPES